MLIGTESSIFVKLSLKLTLVWGKVYKYWTEMVSVDLKSTPHAPTMDHPLFSP